MVPGTSSRVMMLPKSVAMAMSTMLTRLSSSAAAGNSFSSSGYRGRGAGPAAQNAARELGHQLLYGFRTMVEAGAGRHDYGSGAMGAEHPGGGAS